MKVKTVVGRSAELERRRFASMHTFADYIATAADELAPRSDLDRDQRRVQALALVGGTDHPAVEWIRGDLKLSKDQLVETLVALYIAAAHAPAPKTTP